jgi:rhodanese-related sulfurtransferase
VLLVSLGILLAFMPSPSVQKFTLKPADLLQQLAAEENFFTVDEVARFVNTEDSTVQLIDIRSAGEYRKCNIPGSVNVPFDELMNPDWKSLLNQKNVRTIFYGNNDLLAGAASTLVAGLGSKNCFTMKGGLNAWFETVMLSDFKGERITARENAIFENRLKARLAFTQINSLPDSLKTKYFDAKRLQQKKLDGGCE